ncbi:MAG: phage major capsid protein [Actinomycetes bacterium]
MAVNLTRADFEGTLWPPELMEMALNAIVGGAPFSASLTRRGTSSSKVAFPLVDPDGADWVAEGAALPDVTLNDDAYLVAMHKIAGVLDVSNESLSDTAYDVDGAVSQALVDAFSHQMDTGLLSGTGDANHQPTGVFTVADEVTEATTLLTSAAAAMGEIGDAGGTPDTIAVSYTTAATVASEIASGSGALMYPNGFGAAVGLNVVRVPGLAQPLVYDSSRVFFVVREDFSVEQSAHAAWRTDAVSLRVKGRFAVAVPTPAKTIRALPAAA